MQGLMTLEQFGVVAKTLLIMIYQNAYPDVVSLAELDIISVTSILIMPKN